MYENLYGIGSPLVSRSRSYCVDAHCLVSKSICAGSSEEAAQLFYDAMSGVEDLVPEAVFEVWRIEEEEEWP